MMFDKPSKVWNCITIAMMLILIGACRTIPVEDRAGVRQEIKDNGSKTIERLVSENPKLQDKIDLSAGYFVGRVSAVKGPIFGVGSGIGVIYDKEQSSRTYMDVNRFDLGVGLGAGTYSVMALFDDRDSIEKFIAGTWAGGVGAESAAGRKGATGKSTEEGVSLFLLPESGAALVATAQVVKLSVNRDLTDTGVSDISIPNKDFKKPDRQGDDAPRKWDRLLPIFGQKVIDKGYDLPLPYGIGLTFAHVEQEQLISELEVGLNGRPKEPFRFVSFDNAESLSDSLSLKLDAWLFPFMNVFVMLGRVDGKAPVDVVLDGNDMLDHLDIDCNAFPPNPLCPILGDQEIALPTIEANFEGTTYGVGTVLAGGWNNWFVSVPISFTYADMEGKATEGTTLTVTPRGGRIVNIGNWGNLALYGGGNYLEVDLTIEGRVIAPGDVTVDYTIEQKNKDNWNLVAGGNWDINKYFSISAEYNGFIGSREAFITSLSVSF